MWTIGYIHYITNKIAYITYSHVDQDIPYQLKCDKGLFHAWDIIAVGLQEHIYNGIANYDIIDIIKIQNFDISLIEEPTLKSAIKTEVYFKMLTV